MGNLSKNFSRVEFACPCCGADKVDLLLVAALQRLRNRLGAPIVITSGVRCARHNAEVGGVGDSQHLFGRAADFYSEGLQQEELMAMIEDMVREDVIYAGFAYPIKDSDRAVHLDVRVPPSAAVTRWKA